MERPDELVANEAAAMSTVADKAVAIPGRQRLLVVGVALAALAGISATTSSAESETHRLAALLALLLPLPPLFYGAYLLKGGTFPRLSSGLAALRAQGSSPSPHRAFLARASLSERSSRAAWLLLLGVPAALALGAVMHPAAPLDPIVFGVAALLLVAYLVLAARALAGANATPSHAVTLDRPPEPVPARFHRRLRLYRVVQLGAALAFAVPLGVAALEVASGSVTQPLVLFSVAGLLGALACRAFYVDTLERHLQRDPQLARSLERLRRHARKGRPAPLFYAAAVIALIAMALFASRRLLGIVVPEIGA
jgi:hypothetical protein